MIIHKKVIMGEEKKNIANSTGAYMIQCKPVNLIFCEK